MIKYTSDTLELRGIKNVTSKKGNLYYVLNCEYTVDGTPVSYYVSNPDVIPTGLKKGDKIKTIVTYNRFKTLVVNDIVKL